MKRDTVRVEQDALDRTLAQSFPIGVERHRWDRPVIRARGVLKKCAVQANGELPPEPPSSSHG